MGDADLLREAAALMRERAEAAIARDCHGPWRTYGQAVVRDETEGPRLVMIAREGALGWNSSAYRASAAHIASWDPAVALAVADLLDACADNLTPGWIVEDDLVLGPAHAIARAYLGGDRG